MNACCALELLKKGEAVAAQERVSFIRRDVGREEARLADARRSVVTSEESAALLREADPDLWGTCDQKKGDAEKQIPTFGVRAINKRVMPLLRSVLSVESFVAVGTLMANDVIAGGDCQACCCRCWYCIIQECCC